MEGGVVVSLEGVGEAGDVLGRELDGELGPVEDGRLGGNRVIQRRFNLGVPRARVPEHASTRRDRSEG